MSYRQQAVKPSLALWMLVAVVDVGLLVASVGFMTLLLALAGVVTVAGVAVGASLLLRRGVTSGERVPAPMPVRVPTRRGA